MQPLDQFLYRALMDSKLDVAWWAITKGADSTMRNNMPLRMAVEGEDARFVDYLVTEKRVPVSHLAIGHAGKHCYFRGLINESYEP